MEIIEAQTQSATEQPQSPPEVMSPFDLGEWTGKTQAFGLMANRSGSAQAQSLKRIRDSRSFEALNLNWEQFCERKAGISRSYADKLIQRLDEFGANYFKLSGIARISPESYRALAPSVSDEGLEIDGEIVALTPDNAPRIRLVVRRLQEQLAIARKPVAPPDIVQLQMRLDACFKEMGVMAAFAPSRTLHPALVGLVHYSINKLKEIESRAPKF